MVGANGQISDAAIIFKIQFGMTISSGLRVAAGDVTGDGRADVIIGFGPGGSSIVAVIDGSNGGFVTYFVAFDFNYTGGVFVAAGDLDGDGRADIVASQGQTGTTPAKVRAFRGTDFSLMYEFTPFTAETSGPYAGLPAPDGVRVSVVDRDGDGKADIVVGAGPGNGPRVRTFRGIDASQIDEFAAFDPGFRGGVFVG
jgi:serralysin